MRDKKIAVPYADAILGAVKDPKQMETVGADIRRFAEVYAASGDLRKMLNHPGLPNENKQRMLKGVMEKLGLSAPARKSLEVVQRRGRIGFTADIADTYDAMLDEKLGRQTVRVRSAFALSTDEVGVLETVFSKLTGKKAKVEAAVDKSLIGGVVARVGSKVYDGSMSNQLKALKVKLEQEA